MLLLLLRARNKAVSAGIAAGASPAAIASSIDAAWRIAILHARALARAAGMRRLAAELRSMGVPPRVVNATIEEVVRDTLRASTIADNYSKRWRKAADSKGVELANATTDGSVSVIAVTESAEAYNGGRLAALRAYGVQVMRVWDAVLDRQVCPVCEESDGNIVGVNEGFPNGEPGAVHPNCRCTWQPITLAEAA